MHRIANILVMVLAVTFTTKDLMNTACHVGCRKEGYDSGFYIQKGFCEELSVVKMFYNKKQCACLTVLDFNDVTGKSFPKAFPSKGGGGEEEPAGDLSTPSTPLYFPKFNSSF